MISFFSGKRRRKRRMFPGRSNRDCKQPKVAFVDTAGNSPWGCSGVPVHGAIPIVFISIHGVVTQFVNVSFLCVPVHEDTTQSILQLCAWLPSL